MKTLTMVMRTGAEKAPAEEMLYTLIDEQYNFHRIKGTELVKAINENKAVFTNMGINNGKLVSTNGVIDRYTLIDPVGNIVGKPSAVVLNRIEDNNKLVGYTICMPNGTLSELNIKNAVELHKQGLIANSKLRSTSTGEIVQSVRGDYPLRQVSIKKEAEAPSKYELDLIFLGSTVGASKESAKYAGLIINTDSAVDFSKLLPLLEKKNEGLTSKICEITGDDNKASLEIKRTATSGVYAVIPYSDFLTLAKSKGSVLINKLGTFVIACIDSTDSDIIEESNVVVTKDFKLKDKQDGTVKSDSFLKKYIEESIKDLREIGFN